MKFIAFLVLVSFIVSVHAQDYDVSVTTIQVWVKAVDSDGNPVEGLSASDFEVFEDDRKMDTTCFEEVMQEPVPLIKQAAVQTGAAPGGVQVAKQQDEQSTKQQTGPSKVVVFVDLLNTSQAEFLYLKEKANEFFRSLKERRIPVMLVALTATGRMGILERFTTDIDRIRIRFGRLRANVQRDMRVVNARREISRMLQLYDGSPSVKASENLARIAQREEEQEAEGMLNALEALQSFWSTNYSEHAAVLYASGGVNADPGRQYFDMIASYRPDMEANGTLAYPSRGRDLRSKLKRIVGQLNRSNLTFYTLNTRGPLGVIDNSYESNIRMVSNNTYLHDYQEFQDVIAKETGGLSFRNSVNFETGLQDMMTDISHYYMICYSPPEHKEPNQYHEIKVRTNKKDIRLRYRAGYLG